MKETNNTGLSSTEKRGKYFDSLEVKEVDPTEHTFDLDKRVFLD